MNFFDLHCDTAFECYQKGEKFYVNTLAVSGQSGQVFEKWYQTFAVWINDNCENPWLTYKTVLAYFKNQLPEKPDNLTPLFSVEGGALLEGDDDRLYSLKGDEIKFLTLTWNGENRIAGGVKSDKDLTSFGKGVITKMNKLKIGCDLSHLNQKSFYSAIEIADFPLATHSNCFELCQNPRNLTLEQIKLIAEKGGITGLCFYPQFLGGEVYNSLYENISYLCEKGLENHIAIGTDFDGGVMSEELCNIGKVPCLFEYLAKKGLKTELLNKIFYQNAYNYIANL